MQSCSEGHGVCTMLGTHPAAAQCAVRCPGLTPPLKGAGKAAGQEAEELGLRPTHSFLRPWCAGPLEMLASLQAKPAPSSRFIPWPLAPGSVPAPRCAGAQAGCSERLLPPIGPTWHCLSMPSIEGHSQTGSHLPEVIACFLSPGLPASRKAVMIFYIYISSPSKLKQTGDNGMNECMNKWPCRDGDHRPQTTGTC